MGGTRRIQGLMAVGAAGLAVAGLASLGTVSAAEQRERDVIVRAAGQGVETVGLPTTTVPRPTTTAPPVTAPPAPPEPPPTTAPPTTTAAAPTTVAATPRTVAPTVTPTTAATTGGPAMVTLVNQHPMDVAVKVNGRTFQLGPAQVVGPVPITPAPSGNDIVELTVVADPMCGTGDAMGLFSGGRSYRLTVTVSPGGGCPGGIPGPDYRVSPA